MIVSWLFLSGVSEAAEPRRDRSPVTETELGWMVSEIAPLVEEVAGRPFRFVPEVKLATDREIAQVVAAEQRHLRAERGEPQPDPDRGEPPSEQLAPAFAGKYGFIDGKLYVSVDGIEESLAFEGGAPWLLRPLIRVVVAHELAHALQDQHSDLDGLVTGAADSDAIMALNCLAEGHAVWVHERVGELAGLEEAVAVLSELLGDRAPVRRRMDPQSFYRAYVYGLGRDFVAWHARRGGTDEVWRIFADPPVATSMIVAPQTWNREVASVDSTARTAMRRASKRLAARDWQPADSVLGDYDVRDQLVRAGADSTIADDLDAGWNSRLVGGAMSSVEIQVLRFRSDDAAQAFVGNMLDQAEAQADMAGFDPFIFVDAGEFAGVEADVSAREQVWISAFGVGDRLGRVWVARGADVVQVVLMNAPATDKEVAGAIERVLRVLDDR